MRCVEFAFLDECGADTCELDQELQVERVRDGVKVLVANVGGEPVWVEQWERTPSGGARLTRYRAVRVSGRAARTTPCVAPASYITDHTMVVSHRQAPTASQLAWLAAGDAVRVPGEIKPLPGWGTSGAVKAPAPTPKPKLVYTPSGVDVAPPPPLPTTTTLRAKRERCTATVTLLVDATTTACTIKLVEGARSKWTTIVDAASASADVSVHRGEIYASNERVQEFIAELVVLGVTITVTSTLHVSP